MYVWCICTCVFRCADQCTHARQRSKDIWCLALLHPSLFLLDRVSLRVCVWSGDQEDPGDAVCSLGLEMHT